MHRIRSYRAYLQQYGLRRCLFRFRHNLRRRLGLLKRQFPVWDWSDRPLGHWLGASVPQQPEAYRAFREQSASRFFFPLGRPPRPDPEWTAGAAREAQDLLAGRMRYFSRLAGEVGYPEPSWFVNPFTGHHTSAQRHWAEQGVYDPATGDIKFYWEPSRFCWAYALVRAYAPERDNRYAEAFWRILESWMGANPPNMGPNWNSGQEVAIRTLACVFALQAFWHSPATTDQRIAKAVTMLAASAERIAGKIDFARAQMGNHATSEAAGIYTVGVLFPELAGAGQWRELGRWVLEDEVRRFNWEDGSYTQHSMNYQRLMLHAYLWCLRLGELNGEQFSDLLVERLNSSWEFLYQLQDAATGRTPNYGPNDGALMLPLSGCDYLDYRPIINSMHYLLQRRRLYGNGPWQEDLLWLFGGEALEAPVESFERPSRDFPVGGYYTLRGRQSWGMTRCHSYRSRPNQSDALHLDLWWQGVNVLRDSGTFSYFDPLGHWNQYFRSTSAHNTVVLGRESQMVQGPHLRWHSVLRARTIRHLCRGTLELWQGEHYGYRRLRCRATHRRTVCRLDDAYWLVVDDVLGRGTPRTELFWHLPDLPYTREGDAVCLETDAGPASLFVWASAAGEDPLVGKGLEDPTRLGWQSLYYGERTPTPAVCLACEAPLPVRFATLLGLGRRPGITESDLSSAMAWSDEAGGGRVELSAPDLKNDRVVRSIRLGADMEWKPADGAAALTVC